MTQDKIKKKIFIIHGFGVRDGIGWEAGGDLDTVSSNVFYTVWAKREFEKAAGRPAERGRDYDYDFVNYSEGLSHLAAHSGCEVYIPDFPIDALSPRLELMYIPDASAVSSINEFNSKLFALKMQMTKSALSVGDEFKKMFNSSFKQKTKVLEHPEGEALETAVACVDILSAAAEISVAAKKSPSAPLSEYLSALSGNISGEQLRSAKDYILQLMGGFVKEEQIDALDKVKDILKVEESNNGDFSAKGRVNYTDDFMIIMVESMAYAARNIAESRRLPYERANAERIAAVSAEIANTIAALFRNINKLSSGFAAANPEHPAKNLAEKIAAAASRAISAAERAKSPEIPSSSELKQKLTVLLIEQASGRTVEGVGITLKRLLGSGHFETQDGPVEGDVAHITTGADGSAALYYVKASADEEFQISATYDEIKYLMIPEEIISAADSGFAEESVEGEDDDARIDRAMSVSLALLEKQFRWLAANDVTIASITDHHPYTPVVHELLARLKNEGLIKEFNIKASPRGEEEPVEKQVCGANIVYVERIAGSDAKTEGLAELNKMARLQDLHIQTIPLAISLSKLIGSKFSKIEMVSRLAEISDKKSLENIMTFTGWGEVVADYERRLSLVLPRVEANVLKMTFEKPSSGIAALMAKFFPSLGKKNKIEIMAALSAFCDSRPPAREPQINVASAIGHIIGAKKKKADYFFYCYGSDILTQRKMSNSDERINLSTLSQHVGTKADGGHSGASTCKPVSNPSFPRRRLSTVKEANFPEFLYYLGEKIAASVGFGFKKLDMVDFGFRPQLLKNLEKLDPSAIEVVVKSGWMRKKILFAKMPRAERDDRDSNPSIIQAVSYLSSKWRFDYLFLVQGSLSKIIMVNVNDRFADIDLVPVSRAFGWQEDGGVARFAVASPRRNKKISREWRFAKEEQFFELCAFLTKFLEEGLSAPTQKHKWKIHSLLAPRATGVPKELEKFADKFKTAVHDTRLIPPDKKSRPLSVAVVSEPYSDGVRAPALPLCIGMLRRVVHVDLYQYIVYLKYSRIYLINTGDDSRSLDLSALAKNLDSNYAGFSALFASIDRKAAVLPVGFEKITRENAAAFVTRMLEKMASPLGYKVDKVEKKGV